MGSIGRSGGEGGSIRLPDALMQPIASADVVAAMARIALGRPMNGIVEVAGPERVRMAEIVQRYLAAIRDSRQVVADRQAPYFGVELDDGSLVSGPLAWIGATPFESWLAQVRPAT